MRIRLDLSYDGTDFKGWATQPYFAHGPGHARRRAAMALRVPLVRVVCAGRTDTGVHARGQVVHFDVSPEADSQHQRDARRRPALDALVRRLNGILPDDMRVRRAVEAEPGFDARFSAIWRRYAYRIADAPS